MTRVPESPEEDVTVFLDLRDDAMDVLTRKEGLGDLFSTLTRLGGDISMTEGEREGSREGPGSLEVGGVSGRVGAEGLGGGLRTVETGLSNTWTSSSRRKRTCFGDGAKISASSKGEGVRGKSDPGIEVLENERVDCIETLGRLGEFTSAGGFFCCFFCSKGAALMDFFDRGGATCCSTV